MESFAQGHIQSPGSQWSETLTLFYSFVTQSDKSSRPQHSFAPPFGALVGIIIDKFG